MRSYLWLVAVVAISLSSSSRAMTLAEYIDGEARRGGPIPRHEQLNPDVPWTCLAHYDRNDKYSGNESLTTFVFREGPHGEISAHEGKSDAGRKITFEAARETSRLQIALRPAGYLAMTDGFTRYLCVPGDLLFEREPPPVSPLTAKLAEPDIARLFDTARRPLPGELRPGRKWACLTQGAGLESFPMDGKQKPLPNAVKPAPLSLLRFGDYVVAYTGTASPRPTYFSHALLYQGDKAYSPFDCGVSLLQGLWGRADLRLAWSRYSEPERSSYIQAVYTSSDVAETVVRFHEKSHRLVLRYVADEQWTYNGGISHEVRIEGHAVCEPAEGM